MSFLGLALFAEGSTDYRFLGSLLPRVVEEVYLAKGERPLEIGDVVPLTSPEEHRDSTREVKIAEAARVEAGSFHILFVHADGGTRPTRVRGEQVTPGLARALAELGPGYAGVAVIPVREMEAWAVADGNALRAAFRTTLSDAELGVPERPRDCESLRDPKAVLNSAFGNTLRGSRSRIASTAAGSLQLIAETIDLARLADLPAFQSLRGEIEQALRHLKYIR
ncbi:MAG TPA: hypothetical protein VF746_28235 [Longimicrobium sp.]|jgi:hypothetical protein